MSLLTLHDLHKVYPNGTHALKGINLDVKEGEFLVVIGLSGSGKSTLLRCINRLIDPTSGSIRFAGKDVTQLSGAELRRYRAQIGMIFQHFNLINRHSVLHNVLYGALGRLPLLGPLLGHFPDELKVEARRHLTLVGLADKETNRVDALSGGQQQRVAIARSLMQHPRLLLADEPVASLDPATSHSVMQYLEKINKEQGTTIICNLHFLSLVRRYASRVIALRAGEMVFEGKPEDITEAWFKKIYGEDAEEVEIK